MNLRADLLKVGHHGAEDATSQEFLEAVSAGIAVISVDKDNFWGYPSARVLERLKKVGVKVYRTDREGDVVLSIPVAKSLE
ncbi:hypothetical protein KAT45_05070 [Candidatus Aerophobetes bacterium]|nr:hypothetical protein [Candidatus Aerophobetes bacterium]